MEIFRNRDMKQQGIAALAVVLTGSLLSLYISAEAAAAVALTGGILSFLFLWFSWRKYRSIQSLSESLDEILHKEEALEIGHFKEGDLEVLRDEIVKLTARLNQQALQLKEDKRFLADALADISHQIRTPLTSLNLIAQRLRNPELSPEKQKSLQREMTHMLSRISWLVNTLLKLSRLDAGTVTFQHTCFRAVDLLEEALRPFAVSMELRGQTCIREWTGEEEIWGDYGWTLEAVGNVVKNALEYTPEGGRLQLTVRKTALYTELVVTDSGKGIPQEDIPHLFERFYKGKNAGKESFGIGLALTRAILSMEEGTIFAGNAKETGWGGRFTLRFYGRKEQK